MGDNNLFASILNNDANVKGKPQNIDDIDGTKKTNMEHSDKCDSKCSEENILLRHLDPRNDLSADHEIWVCMLRNCFICSEKNKDLGCQSWLWEALHGLRCGGARLKQIKGDIGFRILPGNEDWKDAKEWNKVKKKYLDPIKDELIKLLKITKEQFY